MKNKGTLLFWTDLLIAAMFAVLIATGSILRWVLPPGSGGGQHGAGMGRRGGRGPALTLLDMTRHQWGDLHFWLAAALVAGILLHLALHWRWIVQSAARCLSFGRAGRREPPAALSHSSAPCDQVPHA